MRTFVTGAVFGTDAEEDKQKRNIDYRINSITEEKKGTQRNRVFV